MGGTLRRAALSVRAILWGLVTVVALLGRADLTPSAGASAAATSAPATAAATSAPAPPGTATTPGKGAISEGVPPDPSHARAEALVAEALKMPTAYERMRPLTDTIGARLAGSASEARAVAWAKAEFEKDGLRTRLEPVMVPVWVRGEEHAEILEPGPMPLAMLGLGGSVGTPAEGITAPVVVAGSFDELTALGESRVRGKIVVFDHPFVRTGDEFKDYGAAVKYRGDGPSAAARLGAVAALVRSVATASLRTPHTGGFMYDEAYPRIPAASIATEDALLLHRLVQAGHEVKVHLFMEAHTEPDRPGSNVVAEIRGRKNPREIVLIGAHLDSWDVGTGAIDDGAGVAMVLETMRLLASGPPPRRTVRAVLFANEENGTRGAKDYRDSHQDELARHVAAIEADSGAARALGVSVTAGSGGVDLLRSLLIPVLAPLGASRFKGEGGGADVGHLRKAAVPMLSIDNDGTRYFDFHHTMADTLDKIDPEALQQATATLAATTWILAESQKLLPRLSPEEAAKE